MRGEVALYVPVAPWNMSYDSEEETLAFVRVKLR
jgi:hypothetical protein